MKKILSILLMLILSASLVACNTGTTPSNDSSASETEESSIVEASKTEESASDTSEIKEEVVIGEGDTTEYDYILEDTIRVGEEGKGFVDVPKDWVKFVDVVPNTDFQFCDPTGKQIFTLNKMDFSSLPQEQVASLTTEDAASGYWSIMEEEFGEDSDEIAGSITTVNNMPAHQVYMFFKDGSILSAWFVQVGEGDIYVAIAEGPGETFMESVTLIENTYFPLA